jgi:hypothetical protein
LFGRIIAALNFFTSNFFEGPPSTVRVVSNPDFLSL